MWLKERKDKIWKAVRAILFLIGLCFIISKINQILILKNSTERFQPLIESGAEDYDVLFFGTSHVINSVYPLELWNDYGITSYNCGSYGAPIPTSYFLMQTVLDTMRPKMIVLDCSKLSEDTYINTTVEQAHGAWDAFALSKRKWDIFTHIRDNSEDFDEDMFREFLFPITVYHNRWTELGSSDYNIAYNSKRGAENIDSVAKPNKHKVVAEDKYLEQETLGTEYLEKFIEECQSRGIQILLTYLPFPANATKQTEANHVQLIADKYGVDYINFLRLSVINYQTDCGDSSSHLNQSGAKKITNYLGKYITEHYEITDHRNEPAYDFWNEDFKTYTSNKMKQFKKKTNLTSYLELLADKNVRTCIYIKEGSSLLSDDTIVELLKNIAQGDAQLKMIEEAAEKQSAYFIGFDNPQGYVYETTDVSNYRLEGSSFGDFTLLTQKDGTMAFIADETDKDLFAETSEFADGDIRIIVFYRYANTIADNCGFEVTAKSPVTTKRMTVK